MSARKQQVATGGPVSVLLLAPVILVAGCSPGRDGKDGLDGEDGRDAESCTVIETETGAQIRCPDGSVVNVEDGADGAGGAGGTSCSVERDDPTHTTTVSCTDGTSAVINDARGCSVGRDEVARTTTVTCDDGTTVVIPDGADGLDGVDGSSCSVTRNELAATTTISCTDGTIAVIPDARDGADGTSCSVSRDAAAGLTTVACTDGTSAVITDGAGCSVTRDVAAGTTTVSCDDGTTATVLDGADGAAGTSCTVAHDAIEGTTAVSCSDGSTATVADGHDGAPGVDGFTSLIRQDPIAPGETCIFGGVLVNTGEDLNRNNVLDAAEVTQSTPLCAGHSPCPEVVGSVVIINSLDVAQLAGCESVTGDVIIGCGARPPATNLTSLDGLQSLRHIGGTLTVEGGCSNIDFTGLSGLEQIDVGLSISTANAPRSFVGLEALTFVGGTVEFDEDAALTSLTGLEGLTTVGSLLIQRDPTITSVALPSLSRVNSELRIRDDASLPFAEATALRDQMLSRGGIGGLITICNLQGGPACP